MTPKGYDFPLYSLELVPTAFLGQDDLRFSIPAADGRLVLRRELRRRGEGTSSQVVDCALSDAFPYHNLDVPGFSLAGHDEEWARNMKHWREFMEKLERERHQLVVRSRLEAASRQQVVDEGIFLWGCLSTATQVTHLGKVLTPGKAPRALRDVEDALQGAAERLKVPGRAEQVAEGGFGPARLLRMTELVAKLGELRLAQIRLDQELRQRSDWLAVVRGALMGDLLRLCRVARRVLQPEVAKYLTRARLFPPRRRRSGQEIAPEAAAPALDASQKG